MKGRTTAALLALCLAAGALPLPAAAVSAPSCTASVSSASIGKIVRKDKYTYRINTSGTVSILSFTDKAVGSDGTVSVPAKLSGKPVTALEDSTAEFFRGSWKSVKTVDIPDSVSRMAGCGIGFKDTYVTPDYPLSIGAFSGYQRNPGVVIRCSDGSAAEKYAIEHGVKYNYRNTTDKLKAVPIKDSSSVGARAFKFRWYAVENAEGYRILRSEDGVNFKQVKLLTGKATTVFKDTGLKQGVTYSYKVAAYRRRNGVREYGKYSYVLSVMTKPAAPVLTAAARKTENSLELKIEPQENYKAALFEVYDPANQVWCKADDCTMTASGSKRMKFCIKSYDLVNPFTGRIIEERIDSGRKYKVRARSLGFVKSPFGVKSVYGAYSNVLTVKAK